MRQTPTNPIHQPVSIRSLKITTDLRLHPDFCKAPRAFARDNKVDLADEIFPETDFRKEPDNPGSDKRSNKRSDKRIEETKSNIHLVRHGAIRLFTEPAGEQVRSIDINPSLLRYGAKRYLLSEGDLQLSLDILRTEVTQLLANSLDAQHIVPGHTHDGAPSAYWSLVDSEILLPGIQIPCFHGLSHPSTGPAHGVTKRRIQLGDKKDTRLIRFKKARWESAGPDGLQTVEGVRVRLILKDPGLTDAFAPFGKTARISGIRHLVDFPERSVALVHQAMMAQLEGTYLPVPPEWRDRDQGKPVTHAKVIALLSRLTSIPIEELRAMDEEIRHPSESTRKRLNKDLPVEVSRLRGVPVSTLFEPAVYGTQAPRGTPQPAG